MIMRRTDQGFAWFAVQLVDSAQKDEIVTTQREECDVAIFWESSYDRGDWMMEDYGRVLFLRSLR